MPVQTQIQVRRGTASSWTSTNPTLAAGEIGFETDTGKIKVGNGSSTWSALNYVGAANAIQYVYNATAGQTSFSGADSNGLTLSYTVGAEQVYVNGVLQVRTSDYTATNGTSITLTTATIASDVVTIVAFGTFDIANTYTQAQANATFPLNTSSFFAGKNKIINGDFNINQRNFTSVTATGTFTFDRWKTNLSGGTVTYTPQTFTAGTAPVTGYEGTNFLQIVTSGQTGSNYAQILQPMEDVRTLANQTVTVSLWAKASSGTPYIGGAFVQNFGSGGSASVTTYFTQQNISTSWARYSFTLTVPSVSGKTIGTGSSLQLYIIVSDGGQYSVAQNNTFQIWGVQVEAGSVATSFQTATGTIQGELAACQRYYFRLNATKVYTRWITGGIGQNATNAQFVLTYPVQMRALPTSLDYSALAVYDTNATTAVTSATFDDGGVNSTYINAVVASGLTQYRPYQLIANNNAAAYIGLSAEL